MKTSELIGPALDYSVAKCEGYILYSNAGKICCAKDGDEGFLTKYSTDWSQGGPLIEREWISVYQVGKDVWKADIAGQFNSGACPTPLIAAMRCYCCAKLGDEIEIPQELQPCQQPKT